MPFNAIVLESDTQAAEVFLKELAISPNGLNGLVVRDLNEAKSSLRVYPGIEHVFCICDISDSEEQVREAKLIAFLHQNYPHVRIHSIGSFKRDEILICENKILFFNKRTEKF